MDGLPMEGPRESSSFSVTKPPEKIYSNSNLSPKVVDCNASATVKPASDQTFLENEKVGTNFFITETLLGHGSYGGVFLATDENERKVAVKCCELDEFGIPNILETSIMSSIVHPYLNRALRIHADANDLYIIQEMAETDLCQKTRRDAGNYRPTLEELKSWCWCLSQALSALHHDDIIHADIKASNVLYYKNKFIRLTDFTLSTKKWHPDEKYNHSVGTCTHRPLECLARRYWDKPLDIWSLGCTFYEIAYGLLLFPYQGSLEPTKIKNRETKLRLRYRSMNAILEWNQNHPISSSHTDLMPYKINYIPPTLCKASKNPEMATFNDLLFRMLIVDPDRRPTILEVLAHPFFRDSPPPPTYLTVRRPLNRISIAEQARVTRHIQRSTSNSLIQNLAFSLYSRCNNMSHITETHRALTCVWIASKIINSRNMPKNPPSDEILAFEREICHNLTFHLHYT